MAKTLYTPDSFYPYHVSARCLNKDWFKIPVDDVWEVMSNYLYFLKHAFNFEIISFVLMSNHFHLIVKTPDANLSQGMNYFMRETSRSITKLSNRINQTYGSPYHWSLIKNENYFRHAYKYVYRNPVEAGLSLNAESYRYSTLQSKLGINKDIIPVVEDCLLFDAVEETLQWLNEKYPDESAKTLIKSALKKREFKFSKDKKGRSIVLESLMVK